MTVRMPKHGGDGFGKHDDGGDAGQGRNQIAGKKGRWFHVATAAYCCLVALLIVVNTIYHPTVFWVVLSICLVIATSWMLLDRLQEALQASSTRRNPS